MGDCLSNQQICRAHELSWRDHYPASQADDEANGELFNEYGWPTRDAFGASTKNGYISGDGDYLLKNTIVDLKTSNKATMQIYWVWQLLLYHTLGFYNHFNDEKIDRLMIFNARADIVFYIDVVDIDQSVFEFVNDAAEKQSWVNEKLIKQMIGID